MNPSTLGQFASRTADHFFKKLLSLLVILLVEKTRCGTEGFERRFELRVASIHLCRRANRHGAGPSYCCRQASNGFRRHTLAGANSSRPITIPIGGASSASAPLT